VGLGSRNYFAEVVLGGEISAVVDLGEMFGELQPEDLESGCTEGSCKTGEAAFVGSGVGSFFLGRQICQRESCWRWGNLAASPTACSYQDWEAKIHLIVGWVGGRRGGIGGRARPHRL
jgi:hypothetical protein